MSISIAAEKIASRFTESKVAGTNTAVVYRSPLGVTWGWWRPTPPRMHLRPMTQPYQDLDVWVWLERHGVRAFEVENGGALPHGAIDDLHTWVTTSRTYIERLWLKHLGPLRWLQIKDYDLGLDIVAYRGTDNELRVKTPLSRMIWMGADDGSDAPGDIPF